MTASPHRGISAVGLTHQARVLVRPIFGLKHGWP